MSSRSSRSFRSMHPLFHRERAIPCEAQQFQESVPGNVRPRNAPIFFRAEWEHRFTSKPATKEPMVAVPTAGSRLVKPSFHLHVPAGSPHTNGGQFLGRKHRGPPSLRFPWDLQEPSGYPPTPACIDNDEFDDLRSSGDAFAEQLRARE